VRALSSLACALATKGGGGWSDIARPARVVAHTAKTAADATYSAQADLPRIIIRSDAQRNAHLLLSRAETGNGCGRCLIEMRIRRLGWCRHPPLGAPRMALSVGSKAERA
jgi:hypothetical protein